jgi:hypothetical protein
VFPCGYHCSALVGVPVRQPLRGVITCNIGQLNPSIKRIGMKEAKSLKLKQKR